MNPAANVSNNRLSSADGYQYDLAGNTTRDPQSRKFTFDAENKQTRVETLDANGDVVGTVGEYSYDGDGRRVRKYVPSTGETTVFVYDAAGKQIAEYSAIVAPQTQAKVAYLTSDHLGSPRVDTDQSGAVISRHDYHPFGEEISTQQRIDHPEYAGDSVRKQFTGYERDKETELDFAQARYYANSLGRFSSPDPILSSGNSKIPQTWNRYVYCLNNPTIIVDPTGMWNWSAALGGSTSDKELRKKLKEIEGDKSLTEQAKIEESTKITNILAERQGFRAAIQLAKDVVARADITAEEAISAKAFLNTYGSENDNNGVILAERISGGGVGFTKEENGKVVVAFTQSEYTGPGLWLSVFHEGVHVFQSRVHTNLGWNLSLRDAEYSAYYLGASLFRGIDSAMVKNGNAPANQSFSVGTPPITLWQRGWKEVDMRNGVEQHLQRLGLQDSNGNATEKGAKGAFPGGGQWK